LLPVTNLVAILLVIVLVGDDVDRCLDRSGAWNRERGVCDGLPPD